MNLEDAIKAIETPGWAEYVTWRWREDISKQPEGQRRFAVHMLAYGYAAGYAAGVSSAFDATMMW